MSAQPSTPDEHVLTAHCPEAYGLVSAVASNLTSQGLSLIHISEPTRPY